MIGDISRPCPEKCREQTSYVEQELGRVGRAGTRGPGGLRSLTLVAGGRDFIVFPDSALCCPAAAAGPHARRPEAERGQEQEGHVQGHEAQGRSLAQWRGNALLGARCPRRVPAGVTWLLATQLGHYVSSGDG